LERAAAVTDLHSLPTYTEAPVHPIGRENIKVNQPAPIQYNFFGRANPIKGTAAALFPDLSINTFGPHVEYTDKNGKIWEVEKIDRGEQSNNTETTVYLKRKRFLLWDEKAIIRTSDYEKNVKVPAHATVVEINLGEGRGTHKIEVVYPVALHGFPDPISPIVEALRNLPLESIVATRRIEIPMTNIQDVTQIGYIPGMALPNGIMVINPNLLSSKPEILLKVMRIQHGLNLSQAVQGIFDIFPMWQEAMREDNNLTSPYEDDTPHVDLDDFLSYDYLPGVDSSSPNRKIYPARFRLIDSLAVRLHDEPSLIEDLKDYSNMSKIVNHTLEKINWLKGATWKKALGFDGQEHLSWDESELAGDFWTKAIAYFEAKNSNSKTELKKMKSATPHQFEVLEKTFSKDSIPKEDVIILKKKKSLLLRIFLRVISLGIYG
jgi:hypothetical protein